ncbi:hypothetical protein V2J09_018175 [Rumex salicifolius]
MVFSSVPLYLDPPNWHQDEIPQNVNPQLVAQAAVDGSSSRGGSSSMSERARMAKIPVPEGPLNCPRCDSTNTKFCYFNNYSLTQPRHFCKACRRYWTRGGALRNVPVGGGCRRNKRRKRTKSPSKPQAAQQSPPPDQGLEAAAATAAPFSFMASLQNMTSSMGMGGLGLGFGGAQQLSLLGGGFGSPALTEPSSSTAMYHPFHHQFNGGMETASFGKAVGLKMEEMRSRAQAAGQLRPAITENVSQFWGASFNNSVAGSANDDSMFIVAAY